MINPFILANRGGIPRLESTGTSEQFDKFVFSFKNHRFLNQFFSGFIFFKLPPIPASATATLPVVFDTNGKSQALMSPAGVPVTVADLKQDGGIYITYYDSQSSLLQLLIGF